MALVNIIALSSRYGHDSGVAITVRPNNVDVAYDDVFADQFEAGVPERTIIDRAVIDDNDPGPIRTMQVGQPFPALHPILMNTVRRKNNGWQGRDYTSGCE